MSVLKRSIQKELIELGILTQIPCSKKENEYYQSLVEEGGNLPNNIFEYDGHLNSAYYSIDAESLVLDEIKTLMVCKQAAYLRSIKNGVTFFVIIAILFLLLTIGSLSNM